MNREDTFPENALFCSLCCGYFDLCDSDKIPRILPCLHVFCHGCISSKLTGNCFKCPSCGESHGTGDNLSCFPRDLTLSLLQDTVRVKNSGTRPTCFSCRSPELVNSVCQECICRYICEKCRSAHENLTCLVDHKTFSLADTNSVLVKNVQRKCNLHKNKKINRFCESKECEVPICKKCQKHLHNSHHIRKIKDICDVHESDISTAKKRLIVKKEEVYDNLIKARNTSSDATKYKTQTENFLKESFENSCKMLTDLKIDTERRLQSDYEKQYDTIDDHIGNLMTAKHAVDRCEEYMTYSLEYKSTDDLLECSSTVLKRADNLQNRAMQSLTISPTDLTYSKILPKPVIHGPSTTLILSGKAYVGRRHTFRINLKNREQNIVDAKHVSAFVHIYREDGTVTNISQNIDTSGAINITWIPSNVGNCTIGVLVFMGTIEVWNKQLQVEEPASTHYNDMSEAQARISPSKASQYHGVGDENNDQRQFDEHEPPHVGDLSAIVGFADIVGKQGPNLPIGTHKMFHEMSEYDSMGKEDNWRRPSEDLSIEHDKQLTPERSIPVVVLQERLPSDRGLRSASSSAPNSTLSKFITKFTDRKRTKSDCKE